MKKQIQKVYTGRTPRPRSTLCHRARASLLFCRSEGGEGNNLGCKVVAEISDFVLKEPAVFGRLSSSFLYDIENLGMLSNYVFGRLSSSCKFNFFLPTQRINSFDACYERVNPISREATSLESNSIAGRVLFGLVSGFLFSSCLSPTFLV